MNSGHTDLSTSQKNLIISLFTVLGEHNIISVSSCISRLRIKLKNYDRNASDDIFLTLNTAGVIHTENELQLIYGQQSGLLAKYLTILNNIVKKNEVVQLLILLQGTAQVQSSTVNTLILSFKPHINFSDISLNTIAKSFTYQYTPSQLTIYSNDPKFLEQLQTTIEFWGLVQSQEIIAQIGLNNIISIMLQNTLIKITFASLPNLDFELLKQLGLLINDTNLSNNELYLSHYVPDFFTTLELYYYFKKIINRIDNH